MDFEKLKRRDLFYFVRVFMYLVNMHSLHLRLRFPAKLRGLGILLELIYEIFLYFVTIHIGILFLCTFYLNYHEGDLELLINCLMQITVYSWTILVQIYFRRLRLKSLQNLIYFVNLKYRTRSAIGFTYVTMDKSMAKANKWIKAYLFCGFTGALSWLTVPIFYGDRILPLPCWYPFDYKKPLVYEAMYFLQIVGQIQVAGTFTASSGFFWILCILISGQYDVLCCSLKNVLATVAVNKKSTKSELTELYELQEFAEPEVNEYYCSKEITCGLNTLMAYNKINGSYQDFRYQFRKTFKECIDHHRYIEECLNKIKTVFSPLWFCKTVQAFLTICLVAFISVKSTTANSSLMKILSLAQYMILASTELMMIYYFGKLINEKSQRCGEAILRSPWYIRMTDIKSDLFIFLLKSGRPFQFTAGKIYRLDLDRFRAVMTAAFSFFTLLQKMDKRNN